MNLYYWYWFSSTWVARFLIDGTTVYYGTKIDCRIDGCDGQQQSWASDAKKEGMTCKVNTQVLKLVCEGEKWVKFEFEIVITTCYSLWGWCGESLVVSWPCISYTLPYGSFFGLWTILSESMLTSDRRSMTILVSLEQKWIVILCYFYIII